MKRILKKAVPALLLAALVGTGATATTACSSSKRSSGEVMYERHQSNKGSKVKSNIKVRGTNKKNNRTTRTY